MATRYQVTLTDDVATLLEDRATQSGKTFEVEAQQLLTWALKELRDTPPGVRILLISGPALEQAEAILGSGSLLNAGDLVKKIERLAGVSFQHVRLPFTPGQLEALKEKADRQGMSVRTLIERTAPRIYEHFFDLVERSH